MNEQLTTEILRDRAEHLRSMFPGDSLVDAKIWDFPEGVSFVVHRERKFACVRFYFDGRVTLATKNHIFAENSEKDVPTVQSAIDGLAEFLA